jgi:predicted DCC family thiol-disulfide oxidoreductase YuxK
MSWGGDMTRLIMFFDGACPVCTRTKNMVEARARGQVSFVNIRHPNFMPHQYGKSLKEFTGTLHVFDQVTRQWSIGPDAVRTIDAVAGTGLANKLSSVPFFDKIFNAAYNFVNRNRYKMG